MKKQFITAWTVLALMITVSGCGKDSGDIHEKIHSRFYGMPSYSASCTATVFSNKNKNTYTFDCYYDSASNRYKLEYPDTTVILTDTAAHIINGGSIVDSGVKDEDMLIFVNTFFKNYYTGENTSIKTALSDKSGSTVLETEISGGGKNAKTMKLWINNKSVKPESMEIYDDSGNKKIGVEFKDFEIIKSVDDSIFDY